MALAYLINHVIITLSIRIYKVGFELLPCFSISLLELWFLIIFTLASHLGHFNHRFLHVVSFLAVYVYSCLPTIFAHELIMSYVHILKSYYYINNQDER